LAIILTTNPRLNPGVPGHLPRVVPPSGAVFNGVDLPPGAVVSMSAWVLHQNADLFPAPERFDPRRWDARHSSAAVVRARERALVPFSRGTRACIGQNLAVCEMYCALAALFHRFEDLAVEPGFGRRDLDMVELLIGYHPKKSRRFRVVRKGLA
jgi:cytochrome P450